MSRGLIIVAVLLIIVIVGVTLVLSSSVSDKTLTAEELDGINQACIDCHEDELTGGSIHGVHVEVSCFSCHDSSHNLHAGSDCRNCHTETAGLKTADRSYDTLRWVGVGGAGLLIVILSLNLVVSKLRLRKREN